MAIGSVLGGLFTKQYTIGELMNIDSKRQGRASACQVKLDQVFHELQQENILDKFKALFSKTSVPIYYLTFKFEVTSAIGHNHIVYIRTNPDFSLKNWSNNKVKVYCDCADFKFRSAYTLDKHNSLFKTSKIQSTLGQAISDAPKKGTSLLCKHSFAALSWLMNNWSSVMRTI
jgi:hypothetical protein